MSVFTTKNLTKVYGGEHAGATVKALDGIDLTVRKGEFVSVMGPSGSGKTTLLNLLAGLDRPTSGELTILDQPLADLSPDALAVFRRRNMGFVFQDFNLLDTLTLAENVALPLALDGQAGAGLRRRVERIMSALGLGDCLDRYPYEVSGGQQQRAAVARAVVHEPALILADEPTGNLDSGSARALLEIFATLHAREGATILLVTHDPFAASHSQRVVFIKDGKVFSELDRAGGREDFFQEILNTLAVLEGQSHVVA